MGVGVVAVSVGHGYQAEALMAAGMPFPLLVDRHHRVGQAIGVRGSVLGALNPRGWWRYLRLVLRGQRPRRPTARGLVQMPGVVILGPDAKPRLVHRGRFEGDYPAVNVIVERLEELTRGTSSD
jgi:hypothetical protein